MAELRYNRDTDVYEAHSVNVIAGSQNDVIQTQRPRSDDGYPEEQLLREDYPILCAMYFDDYTGAQVARSLMLSPKDFRAEYDIEVYSLKRDPRSQKKGPGHVLATMADDHRK